MHVHPRPRTLPAGILILGLGMVAPQLAQAQRDDRPADKAVGGKLEQEKPKEKAITPPPAEARATPDAERASGVVSKAESTEVKPKGPYQAVAPAGGGAAPVVSPMRLTINTNALWRDWSRDQARKTDPGAKVDAAAGANSVATKGEPADVNSDVIVEVGPDTKIETRFRLPDFEVNKGEPTPKEAVQKESDNPKQDPPANARPVEFQMADLRPGLFVEVDYKTVQGKNLARTVTVIRPQGEIPKTDGIKGNGRRPGSPIRPMNPSK